MGALDESISEESIALCNMPLPLPASRLVNSEHRAGICEYAGFIMESAHIFYFSEYFERTVGTNARDRIDNSGIGGDILLFAYHGIHAMYPLVDAIELLNECVEHW